MKSSLQSSDYSLRSEKCASLAFATPQRGYSLSEKLDVYFQANAWADGTFCEREILEVAGDLRAAGIIDEVMIGMDNHSAQRTDAMLALYDELQLLPVFTAANCTDCISPVDHHVGRFIQNHMGRAYQAAVERDPQIWRAEAADQEIEDANCTSAMARRMLMAQWLSEAWEDLTTNHRDLIGKSFVHTGFLLAQDGSEDHRMSIQGWPEPPHPAYAFR